MKEFKVTTYLTVSMETTICAQESAEAVKKAKRLCASGEIKPIEICVERESSWAYPTGCTCETQGSLTERTAREPSKDKSNSDFSEAATPDDLPPQVKRLLYRIFGEV